MALHVLAPRGTHDHPLMYPGIVRSRTARTAKQNAGYPGCIRRPGGVFESLPLVTADRHSQSRTHRLKLKNPRPGGEAALRATSSQIENSGTPSPPDVELDLTDVVFLTTGGWINPPDLKQTDPTPRPAHTAAK